MSKEQYLLMCEEMGWEPKDEEMPIDAESLSYNSQVALRLFNILPDRVEGMAGTWLGKEFSCLETFMNIYEVEDRQEVLELIIQIQSAYYEHYRQKQKLKETSRKSKARR